MQKKKIDFKKYADMHEDIELTGKDGTAVTVRDHISYANKVAMAKEIVENNVMIHDDSISYKNYRMRAEQIKAVMKYYTNVPVDDADAYEVADFVINNELLWPICEHIRADYDEYTEIFARMIEGVMSNYDDDQSLKKAIKTSFGFLFNGEDVTESLAKAEMTKDTMFKALDALNKKEKEESEKINNGKLNVGGNVISFAKRE